MIIPSCKPDMNMEAVLEGNLKCLIARNGERRCLIKSNLGTVRWFEIVVRLSEEQGDGERWRGERGMALASSGFLMNTHSYLSISGCTFQPKIAHIRYTYLKIFVLYSLSGQHMNKSHGIAYQKYSSWVPQWKEVNVCIALSVCMVLYREMVPPFLFNFATILRGRLDWEILTGPTSPTKLHGWVNHLNHMGETAMNIPPMVRALLSTFTQQQIQ